MGVAYSKELVVGAYFYRYRNCVIPEGFTKVVSEFYDTVGKDKFRTYGNVTPELIAQYKQFLNEEIQK